MAQVIDLAKARKARAQRAATMALMFGPVVKVTKRKAKQMARKDEVRAKARAAL